MKILRWLVPSRGRDRKNAVCQRRRSSCLVVRLLLALFVVESHSCVEEMYGAVMDCFVWQRKGNNSLCFNGDAPIVFLRFASVNFRVSNLIPFLSLVNFRFIAASWVPLPENLAVRLPTLTR